MLIQWFKCFCCSVPFTVYHVYWKIVWTTMERASSFIKKKLLKKQHIYRNKKLSIVYYYGVIIQASKLFIFRDLINFTRKWCTGGKLKPLVFFFVLLVIQKVQKVESANTRSDWKTTNKKRTYSSCVFTCSGKVQKGGERYTEWLRNNK